MRQVARILFENDYTFYIMEIMAADGMTSKEPGHLQDWYSLVLPLHIQNDIVHNILMG